MGNATSAENEGIGTPFKARRAVVMMQNRETSVPRDTRSDGRWYWRWGRQWYVYDGVPLAPQTLNAKPQTLKPKP